MLLSAQAEASWCFSESVLGAGNAAGSVSLLVNCNLVRQIPFVVPIWAVSWARIPDKWGLWGHKAALLPSLSLALCCIWTRGETGRFICTETQLSSDDLTLPASNNVPGTYLVDKLPLAEKGKERRPMSIHPPFNLYLFFMDKCIIFSFPFQLPKHP